jgi:hypothetical protein
MITDPGTYVDEFLERHGKDITRVSAAKRDEPGVRILENPELRDAR